MSKPRLPIRRSLSLSLGLVALVVGASASAAELGGFPVAVGRGNSIKGLSLADLDADGRSWILATAGENVLVIGRDGVMRPGFPVSLRAPGETVPVGFDAAPAACDLNGDGKLELVIGGASRKLYALSGAGVAVPGFPVALDGAVRGPVACLPSGKGFDVVLATDTGSLTIVAGSGIVPKTIAKIGRGAEGGVAVADLDGDGTLELVIGGGDSRLYVFDTNGKPRKGFPYKMAFRTNGVPALGDIDDDGRLEIVVGSQDFKIHAVDADGKKVAGFPIDTGYRIYGGVALADVDGDLVLDAVIGSGDKSLYVVNGHGQALKGFPVAGSDRFDADAAVGDLDKDGAPEIVVASADGALMRVRADGKHDGVELGGKALGAPMLADLDGDGAPEIVVASQEFAIHAIKGEATGKAEAAILSWPMAGHDAQHTGRFGPNPARFKDLTFVKPQPYVTDPLTVQYRFFDLDREPERDTQIRWLKDGTHVAELDNQRVVPAARIKKHEHWSYTLQEGVNFKAYGAGGLLSRVFASAQLEVLNTAPASPEIRLSPAEPKATSGLEVAVTRPSVDPDGDALSYRYVWLKNDRPQKLDVSTTRVTAHLTHKNEIWQVLVVPFDGEVEGAMSSASVLIHNTPPGPFTILAEPGMPRIDDTITTRIVKQASDDDGDNVTYTYRTWVDATPLDLPEASPSIPPRTLRKHQKVKVEVTAHDDQEAGARTFTELIVSNTPPPSPAVAIWPTSPRTTDNLTLGLLKEPRDADNDLVALKHQWLLEGAKVDFPEVVPHEQTKKGQKWQLTVTPFDGEVDGPPVTVETRILNTPPTRPDVDLSRYVFATDEDVVPRIKLAPKDDDGDPIRLKYLWKKNGVAAGLPDTRGALTGADIAKGEKWEVAILANDGEADGAPAVLRFAIKNTPPTAPQVAVSLERPTVADRSEVRVTRESTDKDGDALTYRYRWFRDDGAVTTWPTTKNALEPRDARKGQHWRVEVRAFDGEEEGEPALAELWPQNHAPEPPAVAVKPAPARTTDELQCVRTAAGTDLDNDPLTYRTRWFVDGKPVAVSLDLDRLPPALTKKGQSWTCEVTSFDGALSSAPVTAQPVAIVNSPPLAPAVSISPAAPRTDVDLVCEVAKPATDADLDRLSYTFAWRVDGKAWQAPAPSPSDIGTSGSRVPASETKRGQTWECEVVASDGTNAAAAVTAHTTIQNSAPLAPRVKLKPDRPAAGEELGCEIIEPAKDPDAEPISYRYVWLKDGVVQSFSPTSTSVPGRMIKANDIWRCQVTPTDGTVNGPTVDSADLMIRAR